MAAFVQIILLLLRRRYQLLSLMRGAWLVHGREEGRFTRAMMRLLGREHSRRRASREEVGDALEIVCPEAHLPHGAAIDYLSRSANCSSDARSSLISEASKISAIPWTTSRRKPLQVDRRRRSGEGIWLVVVPCRDTLQLDLAVHLLSLLQKFKINLNEE